MGAGLVRTTELLGIEHVNSERLWAPWRLGYVQGDKQEPVVSRPLNLLPGADADCFLCQSVADNADRQRYVIHRGSQTFTILNRYPYNNGHLLIAPRRHCGTLEGLTAEEHLELSQCMARMVEVLKKVLNPGGFNIGLNLGAVAGAGLPGHLHWHVVPRWNGDCNFMPAVAGVKVIPQSLDALWEALAEQLAKG